MATKETDTKLETVRCISVNALQSMIQQSGICWSLLKAARQACGPHVLVTMQLITTRLVCFIGNQ